MLNDFIVGHKSTFSDFMEIYVEIFSTSTEFLFECEYSELRSETTTLIRKILSDSEIIPS
jgi:hypothetical protein